jgi:endonuclease/exonuclease/phosphatase family metal-dependent hydrolase
MGYKIGSFNMRNIGLSALGNNNSRDIEKIADIIRTEEFDIVALQEVLSEGKAIYSEDYAKKSILWELGPDWDFSWADAETAGADRRHEGYSPQSG